MVRNAILVLLFSLSVKAEDYTNGGVWNDPDHNGAPVRYFMDNGCAIIGTEGGGAALSDNYYEYFHSDRHLAIPSKAGYFAFRDCRKLKTIILNCDPAIAAAGAFDGTPAAVAAPRLNGFVTVIAEVKGSGAISVPESWSAKYPGFETRYGTDFAKALMRKSGKFAADGTPLLVWHDFVAGTDPTDENDQFTASVSFDDDGNPIIKYSPELTAEQTSLRKYTTYGKVRLQDAVWTVVDSDAANYNFFKVTVEMK